jgi:hypothetical protein
MTDYFCVSPLITFAFYFSLSRAIGLNASYLLALFPRLGLNSIDN